MRISKIFSRYSSWELNWNISDPCLSNCNHFHNLSTGVMFDVNGSSKTLADECTKTGWWSDLLLNEACSVQSWSYCCSYCKYYMWSNNFVTARIFCEKWNYENYLYHLWSAKRGRLAPWMKLTEVNFTVCLSNKMFLNLLCFIDGFFKTQRNFSCGIEKRFQSSSIFAMLPFYRIKTDPYGMSVLDLIIFYRQKYILL